MNASTTVALDAQGAAPHLSIQTSHRLHALNAPGVAPHEPKIHSKSHRLHMLTSRATPCSINDNKPSAPCIQTSGDYAPRVYHMTKEPSTTHT